ncbi:hypothetical protein [Xanthomonas perforans]|uniref:hypothetical protein n=1 Tax=Xanthomonas perforans TaxID=442694 RepID=UPI002359544C|nr:hypothetical protein [Xanthomonas perforans]MDC9654392.1 hypothetical protein [Xanthomonas perforans]MEB2159624.1 hypothetical protein [Xanthomonas campestris pv. campestris]
MNLNNSALAAVHALMTLVYKLARLYTASVYLGGRMLTGLLALGAAAGVQTGTQAVIVAAVTAVHYALYSRVLDRAYVLGAGELSRRMTA